MMRLFLILLLSSFLFSCQQPTGIEEHVSAADSVAINYFKGDGTMDTVTKVVIIRDAARVKALSGYLESGRVKDVQCGFDGSIHFFKKGIVLQDVDFRMNDAQCMHFFFVLGNNIYSTKLSPEAKQFLVSARNGQ
jgi:hypothetical protein